MEYKYKFAFDSRQADNIDHFSAEAGLALTLPRALCSMAAKMMERSMDRDELNATAAMACLSLDAQEADRLAAAVLQMLDYFAKMLEVDVTDLEPTTHVLLRENRLRADRVGAPGEGDSAPARPDLPGDPDRLLENAPELEQRFIAIPNVL